MRRAILSLLVLILAAFEMPTLFTSGARAGEGPCGIALGTWTDGEEICRLVQAHKLTTNYAQDAYMTFREGGQWSQWESFCDIQNAALTGDVCTQRMNCEVEGEQSVAESKFKIIDARTIALEDNQGSYSIRYMFCTATPFLPY
jgi:hypothetical protein